MRFPYTFDISRALKEDDCFFASSFQLCLCSLVQQAKPPKQQGAGDAEEEEEE